MEKGNPPPYSPPAPGFIPPGHPPGHPPEPPKVVTTTTVHATIIPTPLGPNPVGTVCSSCHHNIVTTVQNTPSTKTHLFALLCCVFGLWPCCCIPYCVDSCQSQNHYCPNCQAYLGAYNN